MMIGHDINAILNEIFE